MTTKIKWFKQATEVATDSAQFCLKYLQINVQQKTVFLATNKQNINAHICNSSNQTKFILFEKYNFV